MKAGFVVQPGEEIEFEVIDVRSRKTCTVKVQCREDQPAIQVMTFDGRGLTADIQTVMLRDG